MKATIYTNDEVYTTITGLSDDHHHALWTLMGKEVEGSYWMPARRLGRWDGKLRFFSTDGRLFTNLLSEVAPLLSEWGYEIELVDKRRAVQPIKGRASIEMFDGKSKVKFHLRSYQVDAVNAALNSGTGFVIAATGSGKSAMIAAICDIFSSEDKRIIVIVPSADLVEQMMNTFTLLNIDAGSYSGANKDLDHPVVVGTWQALQNNPSVVSNFDCFIVDEAHGASAKTIGELITKHGEHIPYRFGFTGTWPKQETDQYTLRGSIGDTVYSIDAATLIDEGFLSKLEIEPIEIQELATEEFPDYTAEKAYISRQPQRLDFIADLIIARCQSHGNTLVLVNNIKQGKQLQSLIKDSVFLYGATENEVRAEWYSLFQERDDLIVIATSGIASTGISIDRVFCLIFIDSGKSFTRVIQSVGRGLRKAHDKEFVHVVDIYSSLKWGKKHWRTRLKYYKEAKYPTSKILKVKLSHASN